MTPFIELTEVEYSYPATARCPERTVLNGINLNISRGEFVAIIGPNGSGKSTLVKQLNGLLIPTKGRVLIDGLDTSVESSLIEVRKKVGLLFQNPENQMVASIVEEDVAFGPENLCLPPDEIILRVKEALTAVGMDEFRQQQVHTLSGGQKQRVAIAGLLAMRPECLVLDEPTSMLDPAGRVRLFEILAELHKRGMTIIVITHLMEEAAQADRICLFNKGNVLLDGSAKSVFKNLELIVEQGLEVPEVNRLVNLLIKRGLKVPEDIITIDEMVDYLCTLKPLD